MYKVIAHRPWSWYGAGYTSDLMKVLLGVTGSVAAIKAEELVNELIHENFDVSVVVTEAACHFLDRSKFTVPVYGDADEYACWKNRGDDVLHIKVLCI